MVDAYLGEIRMFAGTFAPQDWAFCDGAVLSQAAYPALFSLIGLAWGGDATHFALPDLRGRVPVGQGKGVNPPLTMRTLGQTGGAETATVYVAGLPAHNHAVNAAVPVATTATPDATVILAATAPPTANYLPNAKLPTPPLSRVLHNDTIGKNIGDQPHDNVMPSFAINFIICMIGLYPQRP